MNEGTKTETPSPEQIIPNSRYKLNENNKQFIFRLPSSIRCPLCCVCVCTIMNSLFPVTKSFQCLKRKDRDSC